MTLTPRQWVRLGQAVSNHVTRFLNRNMGGTRRSHASEHVSSNARLPRPSPSRRAACNSDGGAGSAVAEPLLSPA